LSRSIDDGKTDGTLVKIDADETLNNEAAMGHHETLRVKVKGVNRVRETGRSLLRHGHKPLHGFTIIELLVVIAIISLLIGILMPVLARVRADAREVACRSNLRQAHMAIMVYAGDADGCYPVSQTEHNPHRPMLEAIGAYANQGVLRAFYCTEGDSQEAVASDPERGRPMGATDSVIDTMENREAGRIGYVYFSFRENKISNGDYWRSPDAFAPRELTAFMPQASEVWVLADFWRRGGGGAPGPVSFPHGRGTGRQGGGLNVAFLDGHAALVLGSPQDSFK